MDRDSSDRPPKSTPPSHPRFILELESDADEDLPPPLPLPGGTVSAHAVAGEPAPPSPGGSPEFPPPLPPAPHAVTSTLMAPPPRLEDGPPPLPDEPPPLRAGRVSSPPPALDADSPGGRRPPKTLLLAAGSAVLLAVAALGVFKIVRSKTGGAAAADSPPERSQPVSEKKLKIPTAYGLHVVDRGVAKEVLEYREAPDLPENVEFILFHKAVALGAGNAVKLFQADLVPPPRPNAHPKPDSELSSAEFWKKFQADTDQQSRELEARLNGNPVNGVEVDCQTLPIAGQPEMIRIIPRLKLKPGRYQCNGPNTLLRFYVRRKDLRARHAALAEAAVKGGDWGAAFDNASLALALQEEPSMRRILSELPYLEAMSRAKEAVAAGKWDEAISAASGAVAMGRGDREAAQKILDEAKRSKFKALETEADAALASGDRVGAFAKYSAMLGSFERDAAYAQGTARIKSAVARIQAGDPLNPAFWRMLSRVEAHLNLARNARMFRAEFLGSDRVVSFSKAQTGSGQFSSELKLWDCNRGVLTERGLLLRSSNDCFGPALNAKGGLVAMVDGYGSVDFWDATKTAPYWGGYVRRLEANSNEARKLGVSNGAYLVLGAEKNSPAEAAGLKTNDLIVSVDRVPVSGIRWNLAGDDTPKVGAAVDTGSGAKAVLEVVREGRSINLEIYPKATIRPIGKIGGVPYWIQEVGFMEDSDLLFVRVNDGDRYFFLDPIRIKTTRSEKYDAMAKAVGWHVTQTDVASTQKCVFASARKIVVGTADGKSILAEFPAHIDNPPVYSLAFSSDEKRLASAAEDNSLIIWDVDGGKELKNFGKTNSEYCRRDIFFANRDSLLLSGGENGALVIWDATGAMVGTLPLGMMSYTLAKNGRGLLAACTDGSLQVWGTDTSFEPGGEAAPAQSPEPTPSAAATEAPAKPAVAEATPASEPAAGETEPSPEAVLGESKPTPEPVLGDSKPALEPAAEATVGGVTFAAVPLDRREYDYTSPPTCAISIGGSPRKDLYRTDEVFVFGAESRTWKPRRDPKLVMIRATASESVVVPNTNTHAMDAGRDYRVVTTVREGGADKKVVFRCEFEYRLINFELQAGAGAEPPTTPQATAPASSNSKGALNAIKKEAESLRKETLKKAGNAKAGTVRELLKAADALMATSEDKNSAGDEKNAMMYAQKSLEAYQRASRSMSR